MIEIGHIRKNRRNRVDFILVGRRHDARGGGGSGGDGKRSVLNGEYTARISS